MRGEDANGPKKSALAETAAEFSAHSVARIRKHVAELDAAGIGLTTVCPGPVATNIVSTARFNAPPGKASQVSGRRRLWEKVFAARRYRPEKAAKAIVSAVRKNKPIRPVTPEAYLLYGASRLAPQALRSTARGQVM